MKENIINLLKTHETKIVIFLGFLLVAGLSFEAGFLQGKKAPVSPLIIEKAPQDLKNEPQTTQDIQTTKGAITTKDTTNKEILTLPQNCTYVGSKNSDKYHLPSCQWAKRIKAENMVCFSSIEDATGKNYQPDKGCIK